MDLKSVFLNGFLLKEILVKQPRSLQNEKLSNYVFKHTKALYGLKQVPRAWYERLSSFFIDNGFLLIMTLSI